LLNIELKELACSAQKIYTGKAKPLCCIDCKNIFLYVKEREKNNKEI